MTNYLPPAAAGETYNNNSGDDSRVVVITSRKSTSTTSLLPKSSKQTDLHRYFHSSKFLLHIFTTSFVLFILFQIRTLHGGSVTASSPTTIHYYSFISSFIPSLTTPWQQQQRFPISQTQTSCNPSNNNTLLIQKLRRSVTFLPLKDLRYTNTAYQSHTWFMSTMYDIQDSPGEVQHQHFPSQFSNGQLLCLKGNHTHDGTRNSYALAYPEALPENATLLTGLTFIAYNHYDYANIWHGLTSLFPLTAWYMRNGNCKKLPSRWWLYHYGELRTNISPWLNTLMEATYGGPIQIHGSDHGLDQEGPFCFEEAVVTRHNEGGMSRVRREETFDLLRCKAREYCRVMEVDHKKKKKVGMTMFMRSGGRSFKNDSAVIGVFERVCNMVEGCRLQIAYSNNLTFCQQVKLMSETDVLVSPHGAQLTNMFLMDKNSSVMEFFPKGWLKLAGVGQYVYRSLASWSGMNHRGAWRDPDGPNCPYPEDHRNCMSVYKNAQIGHNLTYFTQWANEVLHDIREWKFGSGMRRDPAPCAYCT